MNASVRTWHCRDTFQTGSMVLTTVAGRSHPSRRPWWELGDGEGGSIELSSVLYTYRLNRSTAAVRLSLTDCDGRVVAHRETHPSCSAGSCRLSPLAQPRWRERILARSVE